MKQLIRTALAAFCCLGAAYPLTLLAQSRVAAVEGQSSETAAREVFEGASVFYRISDTEPTRLVIEGSKIARMNYLKQDVDITKDVASGQAYLTPKVKDKLISMFVTTQSGITFTLMAQPSAGMPSSSLRLVERAAPVTAATLSQARIAPAPGEALSQEQSINNLMMAAASRRPAAGIESAPVGEEVRLWQGVRFWREMVYRSNVLVLDQFDLLVTGTQPIRMVEQEFYKQGVLAVAIEQQVLNPGDSTKVYIVRGAEQ